MSHSWTLPGLVILVPLETFGQQMRERIQRETGLIIGVGLGPTKTLAKLADHAAKKWRGAGFRVSFIRAT